MDFEAVAAQLRKPDGEFGKQVGAKMNESNWYINQYLIENLNLKNHDKLLEIGMGNGFFVKDIFAKEPSVTYTGCDFSETMVEEASQLNQSFIDSGQAQFDRGSTTNLPFANATFDTVFTINTLYFWEKPVDDLAEIHRILKPEGELLVAIRPESLMKKLPFTQYGFTLYEKEGVIELLTGNGFHMLGVFEKDEPVHQNVHGDSVQMVTVIVRAVKQ
ncbi:class I SAM-dependent methyltransferase [Larkinella terrae]|uniref:Methyltransferase domain-containing protein n=1 Tax=Larkinella terrae TaxID=2025311 RepID=A0A7K0EK71_9BACT|nr:class I SAM-dependent methyltransferase [Larkinella terrae]MRS62260.1 methyltransferase domain-containing protein [Larkinella terrae]